MINFWWSWNQMEQPWLVSCVPLVCCAWVLYLASGFLNFSSGEIFWCWRGKWLVVDIENIVKTSTFIKSQWKWQFVSFFSCPFLVNPFISDPSLNLRVTSPRYSYWDIFRVWPKLNCSVLFWWVRLSFCLFLSSIITNAKTKESKSLYLLD